MKERLSNTLTWNEAEFDRLQARHGRLARDFNRARELDGKYPVRLLPSAFALSRWKAGIGVVPCLATYAWGLAAERKGGNGRCHLTIRSVEDPDGQLTLSAISTPELLARYWKPTGRPLRISRQVPLPGSKRKGGRMRHRRRVQSASRNGTWRHELDLYSDFPGIVPGYVWDQLPVWDKDFGGNLFVAAEENWGSVNARTYGDPIVLGETQSSDGVPDYRVLAKFDLSAAEWRAMEHTEQIILGHPRQS